MGGAAGSAGKVAAGQSSAGASAFSLASIGLQAYSSIEGAKGTQAADEYKADRLQRSAEIGRVAAVQTGAQDTQELNMTLGNIDTIRAAAHTDPTSPTGVAVRDNAERLGNAKKTTDVANILAQTEQQDTDAAYMRYAGKQALLAGNISAGSTITKGLADTEWSNFGIGTKRGKSGG